MTANVFGGTVNVIRGLGCGSVSRHWDRFWSGLQDEVLGAQKSEAQQKPWRVPLACKPPLFPSIFFFSATCIQTKVHRALQGGTATLGYLNLKNPEF